MQNNRNNLKMWYFTFSTGEIRSCLSIDKTQCETLCQLIGENWELRLSAALFTKSAKV